jgi:hypothetical protein
MEVDKGAQLISEPSEGDLIFPAARLELLDTPISEVHVCFLSSARARRGVLTSSSSHYATVVKCALEKRVGSFSLSERGLHQGTLLLQVNGRGAD